MTTINTTTGTPFLSKETTDFTPEYVSSIEEFLGIIFSHLDYCENKKQNNLKEAKEIPEKEKRELAIKEALLEYKTETTLWFRGHTNKEWFLNPSIYDRDKEIQVSKTELELKLKEKLAEFKRKSYLLPPHQPAQNLIPVKTLGWFSIMQHYGEPTNLLDWTEFSLYALLFAVQKFVEVEDDSTKLEDLLTKPLPCVWVLKPFKMNLIQIEKCGTDITRYFKEEDINYRIPNTFDLIKGDYIDDDHYLNRHFNIYPHINSNRLLAQHGAFTYFPLNAENRECLTNCKNANQYLYKIELKDPRIIAKQLRQMGIKMETIYPSLTDKN